MKNKKGLSAVIATLMMILLTLVLVGVLWAVITELVGSGLDDTKNCFNIQGKMKIGADFTCYNGTNNTLLVKIEQKDLDADKLILSLSTIGIQKSYGLEKDAKNIGEVWVYGTAGGDVSMPGENAGVTYVFNLTAEGFGEVPKKIELAPVIGGKQCDVIDTLEDIPYCESIL